MKRKFKLIYYTFMKRHSGGYYKGTPHVSKHTTYENAEKAYQKALEENSKRIHPLRFKLEGIIEL